MTLFVIGSSDLRNVLDCSQHSVWRWLRGVEKVRTWSPAGGGKGRGGNGGSTPDAFRFSDVVVALRTNRVRGLQAGDLRAVANLAGADFDPSLPLGDIGVRGHEIRAVLTDTERERLDRCTANFLKGCTYAFWDRVHHIPADIGIMVALCPPVLRYVLLRDRSALPETQKKWADFSSSLVLANSASGTVAKLAGGSPQ